MQPQSRRDQIMNINTILQPFASYRLALRKKNFKSYNYVVWPLKLFVLTLKLFVLTLKLFVLALGLFVLTLKRRVGAIKLLVTMTKQLVIGGDNYSCASY